MEAFVPEAVAARQQTLLAVRQRAAAALGTWMKDEELLQAALACTLRRPADVLDFMFNAAVARVAKQKQKTLSVSLEEWGMLFGSGSRPIRIDHVEKMQQDSNYTTQVDRVKTALRCTVNEQTQGSAWASPWTRTACLVAMHVDANERFLAGCLTNVVSADSRRLEDLRCELDDEGMPVLMMCEVLSALARSVT